MVDIFMDMVPCDFLTTNSPRTYQRYFRAANFLFHRPNIVNIINSIDGKETGSRTAAILHLDDETLFSSWRKEGLL